MSGCFTAIGLAKFFNVNPKTIRRRLWARTIAACEVRRIWRIVKEDMREKNGMIWKRGNINQAGARAKENKSIRSSEKI